MPTCWPPADNPSRAQSNLIGFVLLLAITMLGVTGIIVVGGNALTSTQQQVQLQRAEHAMTQLDSTAATVAIGQSPTQSATLPQSGDATISTNPNAGWINVSFYNTSTGELETVIVNTTLGAVEYEIDDTTIAYQAGGVWRKTTNRSVMVSRPEVHYRGSTLTMPIIVVTNEAVLDEQIQIKQGSQTREYPNQSADLSNPIGDVKVKITVHSEYYQAWHTFFTTRTDGIVAIDHVNKTATLRLLNPQNQASLSNAVASMASGYQLEIDNDSSVDSYDSSLGDYESQTPGRHGDITIGGGVKLQNGAQVNGDLTSGSGTVTLEDADTEIDGNLSYGGTLDQQGGTITGWTANNGTAPDFDPVTALVDDKNEELQNANDNDDTPVITSANELNTSHSPWELTAGEYYFTKIEIPESRTLELDTSSGDITIAVDENTEINGDIEVTGSGTVRIYQEGTDFKLDGGNVTVPGDKSHQLWVYGPSNIQVELDNSGTFVGVVYAPGENSQIKLDNGAEIYGAVVGRVTEMDNSAMIHFDTALEGRSAIGDDATALTFLHISVNRVEVTE